MTPRKLPPHIVSLINHVQLSESGWNVKAQELVIQAVLLELNKAMSESDLLKEINCLLPSPLGPAQIDPILNRLSSDNRIIQIGSGEWKLSEETRDDLRKNQDADETLELQVLEYFEQLCEEEQLNGELTWQVFYDDFLVALVSELGAYTYELISGQSIEYKSAKTFLKFLDGFDKSIRQDVSKVLLRFMDPDVPEARVYILRLLNSAFLIESLSMNEEVTNSIYATMASNISMKVICDTNFVFSLIGLHDNPADDVVTALRDIVGKLRGHVDVNLYLLPTTVDEIKRTLVGYEGWLSGLVVTKAIANAAKNRSRELSGVTLKYISESIRTGTRLSPKDYFEPYYNNILQICKDKGIVLYNENIDKMSTEQEVVDDVINAQENGKRKQLDRPKSYQKILHDMILWHFVYKKRPARIESMIDAEFWVATLDYGLIAFDRRRRPKDYPPVCIHPSVLLQILQLWIPRSLELDSALLSSLRPLVPQHFDKDAERVTIRILRKISRFENASDITEETITRMLADEALRVRVGKVPVDSVEEEAIIRSALAEENRVLRMQADRLKREKDGLGKKLQTQSTEIDTMKNEIDDYMEISEQREKQLGTEVSELGTEVSVLKKRLAWTVTASTTLLATIILIIYRPNISNILQDIFQVGPFIIVVLSALIVLGGAGLVASLCTIKYNVIRNDNVCSYIRRVTLWLWGGVILSILIGIGIAVST